METTGWVLLAIGAMGLLYIGFSGMADAESASAVAGRALVAALILFLLGLILVLESTQF